MSETSSCNVPGASSSPSSSTSRLRPYGLYRLPGHSPVGGYNHTFVAIDKFTKWIKVKPVTATTVAKAAEFIAVISHRFGVLNRIITDLGTSFMGFEFWD